jgi:formylglycine-generating enzyme required for sulfatase activity
MLWIAGGEFSMGSRADSEALCELAGTTRDALPVHRVYVDGFWLDATELTNAEFARFVSATGYVTIAERIPTPDELPGVPAELLVEGSAVFTPPATPVSLTDPGEWWRFRGGASWRHPEGPGSSIAGKERHPVVQLAFADAEAYASWAKKRLPTEAEWEFAARGGLTGKLYTWGDDWHPNGAAMANTYQGTFPDHDSAEDGFGGLAPVASFAPNAYGLYDMAGNAWEWVSDWYRPDYYAELARAGVARNPRGPAASLDPAEPGALKRVQRGGSFLCTDRYCTRYLVGARGRGEISSTGNHVGVRLARSTARRK